MIRSLFLISTVFLLASLANRMSAQEMWGLSGSNYAGQMGLELNPASIAAAPYRNEFHILSFDQALMNNYLYLRKNSKVLKNGFKSETNGNEKLMTNDSEDDKQAYASGFVKLPGFIHSGKKFSYAFHTSSRLEASAANVPAHLAGNLKDGFDPAPQGSAAYQIRDLSIGLLNWNSIGGSVAMVLLNQPKSFFTAGLSLNYNYGLHGAFVTIDHASYALPADTLPVLESLSGSYGYALPAEGGISAADLLTNRGSGWSTSIGMQYIRNRNEEFYNPCKEAPDGKPYDWKLGISLLDAGYIRFNNQASAYRFDVRGADWFGFDTTNLDGSMNSDSVINAQLNGIYDPSLLRSSFTMYLPAAASLQFDWALKQHYFINFSILQGIPAGENAIRRSSQIAVTPRYETRGFEISLPFSLYDYFRPRMGLGVRVGAFSLGTDMPGALLGITDAYGANVYFGVSIKNFGKCADGKGGRKPRMKENLIPLN